MSGWEWEPRITRQLNYGPTWQSPKNWGDDDEVKPPSKAMGRSSKPMWLGDIETGELKLIATTQAAAEYMGVDPKRMQDYANKGYVLNGRWHVARTQEQCQSWLNRTKQQRKGRCFYDPKTGHVYKSKTAVDLCSEIGVSSRTIYKMIERGHLCEKQ